MRFKTGLWLGHSRTFSDLSWRHSSIVLAVGFGSVLCWKLYLLPCLRSCALLSRISSRNCLYLAALIPVPTIQNHPYGMMPAPPYFLLGMVLASWWAWPGFHLIHYLKIRTKSWIFVFVQRAQFMFSSCFQRHTSVCHMSFTHKLLLSSYSTRKAWLMDYFWNVLPDGFPISVEDI